MTYMSGTDIMLLGKLRGVGAAEPMLRANYFSPRRVTPQQPQNLLRASAIGGIHSMGRLLSGLGDAVDASLAAGVPNTSDTVPDTGNVQPVTFPTVSFPKPSFSVQLGPLLAAASLSIVSAGISAYHGYRRDRSAMAGVGWGFMGALFPVVTPVVAFAQGYAKPHGRR